MARYIWTDHLYSSAKEECFNEFAYKCYVWKVKFLNICTAVLFSERFQRENGTRTIQLLKIMVFAVKYLETANSEIDGIFHSHFSYNVKRWVVENTVLQSATNDGSDISIESIQNHFFYSKIMFNVMYSAKADLVSWNFNLACVVIFRAGMFLVQWSVWS